jgi:NAD(P)-dependent dehydrogenase (short-subunit alcohol dehydrogenase family)
LPFKRALPVVWVVGGSGDLGRAVALQLEPAYNVVNLSRRSAGSNSGRLHNVRVDLSVAVRVRAAVSALLREDVPRGVVFCQRYRPSPKARDAGILAAVTTEVLASQAIIEQILASRKTAARRRAPVSVVVVSSANANLMSEDLPFWYHLLKASQLQLTRYYSALSRGHGRLHINCIAAGTFLKQPLSSYPTSRQAFLKRLARRTAAQRVAGVQDIARLVQWLISDDAAVLNGQILTVDGGLSNILQETLI